MKRISHHSRLSWLLASLLFLPVLVSGQAIPVTVGMNSEGQWQLYRNGEPYYINGVGGTDHLDLAAACGANSFGPGVRMMPVNYLMKHNAWYDGHVWPMGSA